MKKTSKEIFQETPEVQLSEHYWLSDFVCTAEAIRYGIDNTPYTEEDVEALRLICNKVMEPLRARFGVLKIARGYLIPELCDKAFGDKSSQHGRGEEVDLLVSSVDVLRKYYRFITEQLSYDQVTVELKPRGKVHRLHISYVNPQENRNRVTSHYPLW